MLNNKHKFKIINLSVALLVLILALITIFHRPTQSSIESFAGIRIKQVAYNLTTAVNNSLTNSSNKKTYQAIILNLNNNLKILENENTELKTLLSLKNQLELENQGLKNKLNYVNNAKIGTFISTYIITKLTSSINSNITISAGKEQNVKAGNLVLNTDGVVGYVNVAYNNSASVVTLFDKEFRMAAKTSITGYNVVLFGNESNFLNISAYTEKYSFNDGEIVYTSGLENKYPPNLPIGTIIKLKNGYKVKPFYNLHKSDTYVFLLQ